MASEPRYLSLPQLFSSKLFRIPDYQRGYAWTQRQLEDLWTDLEVLEEGVQHFTGMIVVKLRKERYNEQEMCPYEELEVIDGQQRLTTLVLLMHSVIHALRSIGDEEATRQSDKLHDTFIGKSGWFRLALNDDSRTYFEHLLDTGEPLTSVDNGSQQNLLNAIRYFRAQIDSFGDDPGSRLAGLRGLVSRLQQSLRFVYYQVDNDAEAGLILEVMNNRGKDLSQVGNRNLRKQSDLREAFASAKRPAPARARETRLSYEGLAAGNAPSQQGGPGGATSPGRRRQSSRPGGLFRRWLAL